MEDSSIIKVNLERFQRLLEGETDPVKRRMIGELIRKTETELRHHQPSRTTPSQGDFRSGGCLQ